MIRKKILIHSIVFSPDSVSTAYLYNDIAIGFKNAGYDVVVLTTTPHYNLIETTLIKQPLKRKFIGVFYESEFEGIRVIHVPLKKYKSTFIRILSFIYWHFTSLIIGLTIKKVDFILSPSPPLSIGIVSILIAKKNGAKFIYNVQEIYPDLLIKNGSLKSTLIIKTLKWLEKYVYNNSSAVVTIDQKFYDQIVNRFKNKSKLKIVPNFVDTELYTPLSKDDEFPNSFVKNSNIFRLLYAGNIGFYQDWEPVLFAAKKLLEENIEFWIIGEGVKKDYLIKEVKKHNLTNIKILPYQDRKFMPYINSLADIHFICINKEMNQEGFPSKIYTIMACAKPIIVMAGENSPVYHFLKNLNCSILINDYNYQSFTNTILNISQNRPLLEKLGANGLKTINENFSKVKVVKKYIEIIDKL